MNRRRRATATSLLIALTVSSSTVRAAEPSPVERVEPLAPAVAAPARAIRIEGLAELDRLVAGDTTVQPKVGRLVSRRNVGYGLVAGGLVVGVTVALLGALVPKERDCGGFHQPCHDVHSPNFIIIGVGAAVAILGTVLGISTMPRRAEVEGAVDDWNARHPDGPLVFE